MKIIDITLIFAGAYVVSGAACAPYAPSGIDAMDAAPLPDSAWTDAASADAGVDALDDGWAIDAETRVFKGLCEICTDDSECIDGTVCVSIEHPLLKECHDTCRTDEDCRGSECVEKDGRWYCDPDEPCYPRCESDKPFFD